jgi:hypothetical protein
MRSRRIVAFYNGHCRVCAKVLPKGSECFFAKHYGMRCIECGPHTDEDTRIPSKSKAARRSPEPSPKREPPRTPSHWTPLKDHPQFRPADQTPGFDAADRCARRDADGIHRVEYGSVREIVEDALSTYAQTPENEARLRALHALAFTGDYKWANYYTRERLLDQVFNPPGDLLRAVDRMREHLIGELDLPTRPRRQVRRGLDWGDELDADRWLHRDPAPWERTERAPEPRRTITIGCNVSAHHQIKPEQLLYRGAAALALADLLTSQGCNVGIVLFKCVESPTNQVEQGVVRCVLKAPDMPLDLSALTFALCEIAFYRCVVVCAAARRWPGKLGSGLGYPNGLPAPDRRGLDYLIDSNVLGEDAAVSWLREQMGGSAHD